MAKKVTKNKIPKFQNTCIIGLTDWSASHHKMIDSMEVWDLPALMSNILHLKPDLNCHNLSKQTSTISYSVAAKTD